MENHRTGMAAVIKIVVLLCFAYLQHPAEGHPLQKRCHISKYKMVRPDMMDAASKLQIQPKYKPICNQGLRLINFPNCDIKGKARLMLTLDRLSLVIRVLENMNTTGNLIKTQLVAQNLETFSILQTDLMNCEKVQSPNLKKCQRHLNQYRKTVTSECLENDVLQNLVWILIDDVGYLVNGVPSSAEGIKKADRHVKAKEPAAKKRKGKRKKKNNKIKKMAN
ncbi:uncharacterized protein LOC130291364 [Hyla sarda]|uniref:uncharacterized protein LOC130291364 n=1 Tax=Hyla sarda TaxID=327740 RepID=UPI0024C28B8B|nr:uncharacterized protein LOC130291364 [Hyla sarda]